MRMLRIKLRWVTGKASVLGAVQPRALQPEPYIDRRAIGKEGQRETER